MPATSAAPGLPQKILAARIVTAVVLIALVGAGLFFLPNAWWSAATLCVLARASFEWSALGRYGALARWGYIPWPR